MVVQSFAPTLCPPGGPGKAKCWYKFMKNCLKRESIPKSPVCQASMLTIRPWMLCCGGLMRSCGAVATCVWSAYGLRTSRFDCLRREGIQLTRMNGVRASALAFCSGGCRFDFRLWWPYNMPTRTQRQLMVDGQSGHRLRPVMQRNGGSCMLVACGLRWTTQDGKTSGGQTVDG